jgi:hypothetical protein
VVLEFETIAQSSRVATSVRGILAGRGADIILIDDPLSPRARRRKRNARPPTSRATTVYSRLNDTRTGAILLIMRRLHESLPSGVTRGAISPCWTEPWEVVCLPAIADDEELDRVETVLGRQSVGR